MRTDTKFFTNEDGNSLLDRFCGILRRAQFFDVIVGYFRASGFAQLARDLENVDKIRILVGLNTDIVPNAEECADRAAANALPVYSIADVRQGYGKSVEREFENAPETLATEESMRHSWTSSARASLSCVAIPPAISMPRSILCATGTTPASAA